MRPDQSFGRCVGPLAGNLARLVSAILLSACSISSGFAASTGSWVTDPFKACRVWNPHPTPGETVSWSGACANGLAHGPGTVQWLRDNIAFEKDEGEWREGRQFGFGKQEWPSGRYEGELANSEPHGHGILTLRALRYEGQFQNGKPNGPGTVKTLTEVFRGDWKDGCFFDGKRRAAVAVPLSSCP